MPRELRILTMWLAAQYVKELYQIPEIRATVDMEHIKMSFFGSQVNLNPSGVIPAGPNIDYMAPHDRDRVYY